MPIICKQTEYECECGKCHHHWKTRKGTVPVLCPACGTGLWQNYVANPKLE